MWSLLPLFLFFYLFYLEITSGISLFIFIENIRLQHKKAQKVFVFVDFNLQFWNHNIQEWTCCWFNRPIGFYATQQSRRKRKTITTNIQFTHEKDMTLIASLSSESTRFNCPSSWYDCIIKYRLIKRKKNSRKTVPTWYDWSIFFGILVTKYIEFRIIFYGCCRFCMCLLTHALLATTSKFIYEVKTSKHTNSLTS